MSVGAKSGTRSVVFNLPNNLTWLRLIAAVVLFCTMAAGQYFASLLLFLFAAATDWLDGYLARKYQLITTLGRILDPFADKVVVCGTFIYLSSIPTSGVAPWMSVVIVGRELLVTALRSFLEERGGDFSAKLLGKLKMVVQCTAAPLAIFALHLGPNQVEPWYHWLTVSAVWAALALTVLSGLDYVRLAVRMLNA